MTAEWTPDYGLETETRVRGNEMMQRILEFTQKQFQI